MDYLSERVISRLDKNMFHVFYCALRNNLDVVKILF